MVKGVGVPPWAAVRTEPLTPKDTVFPTTTGLVLTTFTTPTLGKSSRTRIQEHKSSLEARTAPVSLSVNVPLAQFWKRT